MFNSCRKLFHLLILSQRNCSLFRYSPVSVNYDYLIVSFPDFLLQPSLKLFVRGFYSHAISDPIAEQVEFFGLFQILVLVIGFPDRSWLYVFAIITSDIKTPASLLESFPAFPLTVFSSSCPKLRVFIPCSATFRFRLTLHAMFCNIGILSRSQPFRLRHSLQQSLSVSVCTDMMPDLSEQWELASLFLTELFKCHFLHFSFLLFY